MEQTEKIGIFRMLGIAIAKPEEYEKLKGIRKRKMLSYAMLVALILTFVGSMIPIFAFGVSIGGPKHFIMETLPAFEYRDGSFHIDQRIAIEQNGVRIIADDQVERFTKKDLQENSMEILISKNNIYLKNSATGQNIGFNFKTLGKGVFQNKDLVGLLPIFYAGIALSVLFVYLYSLANYLVWAMIFTLFGKSFCLKAKKPYVFSECFVYALLARTLACIITSMGTAAGFAFFGSTTWVIIEVFIVLVYLYMAICGTKKEPSL